MSVQNDDNHRSVLPSSSIEEGSCSVAVEVSDSEGKENALVEKVQEIALDSSSSVKTEWTTSRASIHLTTSVHNKTGAMFEEEEEGELDYEEDEGEVPGGQEDKNGLRNDVDDGKEEGEVEDDEQDDEGEEGEILSDDDDKVNAEKKPQEQKDSAKNEADGPEEGEVIDDGDSMGAPVLRTKVCRYFMYGGCTWGNSCRFLHPGHNDKGAYQMLPEPGQYPSPFPKAPAVVPPIHPDAMVIPDQDLSQLGDEVNDNSVQPALEVIPPTKKETAWERGLKRAKEIKKAAQKRKEEDADFKEKRMILGITAEDDEDENDKENTMRRREMMRSRLEKEAIHCEEDDVRYRRGADIVSRWRDKRETSPLQYRDRDRKKKRGFRTPSSSPERDRRNRRRGGEKDKQKEKNKENVKERETEQTRKGTKELEKTSEEKFKKKKDRGKEKETEEEKNDSADKEQTTPALKEQQERTTDEKKNRDEGKKKRTHESSAETEVKTAKDIEKKEETRELDDKDKAKPKALGISSSRLPNDDWIDPWQRTTSPKRQSASSRSSRSRSSSSSSDSSRSSRSRSHSGSESHSTSRSASRSRSRSVSAASSRSRSRSHSGSRSKSRSRSGSRSSGSDRSSSSSSHSPMKEAKTAPNADDDRGAKQASNESSDSESESTKSKSRSPTPVSKSPIKPKASPDKGPRTPPIESSTGRYFKEKRNRYEYGRADRIEKWRETQLRYNNPWDPRRMGGTRPTEDPYRERERGYHSRRGRSPTRRRRSRSPRRRNEDRRRPDELKTRERSSSADSMEHALARPSSPRGTRERGGMRGVSSASSSDSESTDSGSQSEDEQNPPKTRRTAPEQIKQARNVPLTSGNIRYTGHKDIKLTLNKSVTRKDNLEPSKQPAPHSPPARSEASSSSDKPSAFKKRPRDSPSVPDAPAARKEAVSSSMPSAIKPDKQSADPHVESASSGRGNAANTTSRREELLRELKAVEDAIARKRARIE